MPTPSTNDVTGWLVAWTNGDHAALDKLVPVVYQELHRLARRYMRRERGLAQAGQTLQTTALVNEVYLRLVDASRVQWQSRAHFLAISANLMRRILVDAARTRRYAKRGGEDRPIQLEEAAAIATPRARDLVALDDALAALAKIDARKAQVVELRFFGGLSVEESAHVLNVSAGTVMRDWSMSKAWLLRELSAEDDSTSEHSET
ncbi:MAG TPA: ECF-type sigma factor [Bryobacteraceae bacterium]|nr:ECF-type sigma factor [Bryobacteraceae bacterium]